MKLFKENFYFDKMLDNLESNFPNEIKISIRKYIFYLSIKEVCTNLSHYHKRMSNIYSSHTNKHLRMNISKIHVYL